MKKLYAVKQPLEKFKNLMEKELEKILADTETNGYIDIIKDDTPITELLNYARSLSKAEYEKYVIRKIYGKTKRDWAYIVCPRSISFGEDGLNLLNYIEALYFKTAVPYTLAILDSEKIEDLPMDKKIELVKQESNKTIFVPMKENAEYAIAENEPGVNVKNIIIL